MVNDILTDDIALSMKRTLLMLAEKQYGVKITNVYITRPDGSTVDESDKYLVRSGAIKYNKSVVPSK